MKIADLFNETQEVPGLARPVLALALWLAAAGCSSDKDAQRDAQRDALGGDTTVFGDTSPTAFSHLAQNATAEHEERFFVGRSFFKANWVTAPGVNASRDGLGPVFNARSCDGCHLRDGRGRPPLSPAEPIVGLLFRLSTATDPSGPEPTYGGQLQPYGMLNIPGEGRPRIDVVAMPGTYADGSPFMLLAPRYSFDDLAHGPMVADALVSPRVAPQMIGMGLLELVPEAQLLAIADPDDADGDGISGRARYVTSETGDPVLGRFGWKGGQPSVRAQTAGAFLGDMGITSTLHPNQECTAAQTACLAAVSGGDPEIPDAMLDDVVIYSSLLAVPARRDLDDQVAERGEDVFDDIGCSSCHTPSFVTGASDLFPELAAQRIRPFTDLLLHDMGPDLADGRPEGSATGSEWRTPPLWGLGLIEAVDDHTRLLHDGRARNAEEAILWHGGEGLASRDRFLALPVADRGALLRFLETL